MSSSKDGSGTEGESGQPGTEASYEGGCQNDDLKDPDPAITSGEGDNIMTLWRGNRFGIISALKGE